ncbi:MAG: hypothetical protein ACYS26_19910 [Planctomycetota bacterium]|jgi:hypothetical protein
MNAQQNEELWNCVQAALDEVREPLEDEGVLALWSSASTAERDEVARLLARLEALPFGAPRQSPSPTVRPLRRVQPWAVAAALLALPLASLWTRAPQPASSAAPSAIYEAQLSVERQSPPPARLQRATRAVERHFTWNVAGESGRLEVR